MVEQSILKQLTKFETYVGAFVIWCAFSIPIGIFAEVYNPLGLMISNIFFSLLLSVAIAKNGGYD